MKKFIAVIGGHDAGKSTVIVSLTGCRYRSLQGPVIDELSKEKIYVIASSPQEKELSQEESSQKKLSQKKLFQDIISKVGQDKKYQGLIMAIEPSRPRRRIS